MSDFSVFFHVLFIRAETVGVWFISLCVTRSDSSMKPKCGVFGINTKGICLPVSSDLHVYLCELGFSGTGKFQLWALCWKCSLRAVTSRTSFMCLNQHLPRAELNTFLAPVPSTEAPLSSENRQLVPAGGNPSEGWGLLARAGGVTGWGGRNPLEVKDGRSDTEISLWN